GAAAHKGTRSRRRGTRGCRWREVRHHVRAVRELPAPGVLRHHLPVVEEAEGDVGHAVRDERGVDLLEQVFLRGEGEVDLDLGAVLELLHDLLHGGVFFGVVALVPPHDHLGGLRPRDEREAADGRGAGGERGGLEKLAAGLTHAWCLLVECGREYTAAVGRSQGRWYHSRPCCRSW